MSDIKVDPLELNLQNKNLFSTLLYFWEDSGWFDQRTSQFKGEAITEILNEISSSHFHDDFEKVDLLMSTLQVIENKSTTKSTILKIDHVSFFGDKNFAFQFDVKGEKSPIANYLVESYSQVGMAPKKAFEALYLFKKIKAALSPLSIRIEFDEKLNRREVYKVTRAYPFLIREGEGDKSKYSLKYKVLLDSGETHIIENNEFVGDNRGYLKIKDRYILIPDDVFEALAKQRSLSGMNNRVASAVINNPTQSLFPPGTNTEMFDMSDYDERVQSFENVPRLKFREIVSSGIEWYKTEDGKIPFITIQNGDGANVNVEVSRGVIESLISKMEVSIESGIKLADGNPRPIEDDSGNLIAASESNLTYLKSFRDIFIKKEIEDKGKKEPSQSNNKVAVLKEIILPENTEESEDINLNKEELEEFLNKEIFLKPHQIDGINWLLNSFFVGNGGVLLCDDMGLGKTLQLILFFTVLRHVGKIKKLKKFKDKVSQHKPSLVVAPLILINNWEFEVRKFVKEEYAFSVYKLHGNNLNSIKNQDGTLFKNWWRNYNLILTNYNTFGRYQVDLLRYPFLVSFFDESQNIKNPDIAVSRAARGLNSEFIVCVTGTPVEIRLMDLWTQMDALKRRPTNPLGSVNDFTRDYEKNEDGPPKIRQIIKLNEKGCLMLRREKLLLRNAGELPGKIIHDPYFIQMTPQQEAQEAFIVESFAGNSLKIIQNLQMLYQHPYLLSRTDDDVNIDDVINDSPKLMKTIEILNMIREKNEKVLVFTLWTRMQSLLQRALKEKFDLEVDVINGEINAKTKNTSASPALITIDKFTEKAGFNILILSPLAAGAGLNITAANHVIHYGRWWNPAKEDQSTDRAYRIGQKKTVHVHYPVLVSSTGEGFDKKLDERVRERRAMALDILTPVNDSDIKFETQKS